MTGSRGDGYFEGMYRRQADPWGFLTSAYEREKYHTTMAVLAGRQFASGFEAGCSIGVLTRALAGCCDRLLAVDVAQTALAAAQRHCAGLAQVRFEQRRIPEGWPDGERFDLIVLSEVLYFLAPADVAAVARLAGEGLETGGRVVLVNYTGPMDEPCSGDRAAEVFMAAAAPVLRRSLALTRQRYRIDMLERGGGESESG